MKKSIIICGTAICVVSGILLYFSQNNLSSLCSSEVEALAGCEILNKKGEIVYQCIGNEGHCDPKSAMGHTLICSGTEVTR